MKRLLLVFLALLVTGVSGALAQDVRYNFDKDAKFSDYKTYKWVEIKGSDRPNELIDKQIKAALEAELATKGLTETNSDDADLYIDYQRASGLRSNLTATRRVGAPAAGAAAGMVPAVP